MTVWSVFLFSWNYKRFIYIENGLSSARSDIVSNFPLCSREPVSSFLERCELPTLMTRGERSIRLRLLGSFFVWICPIMKKINESFVCINCWKEIPLADKTCRNHCPYCFVSLHVDGDIPWDRSSICKWIMYPVEYQLKNSDYKILFVCSKCGKKHWNKRAKDDEIIKLPELMKSYSKYF